VAFLLYLVYALAVARATRLIAEDKILETPRIWLLAKMKEGSLLEYGLTCRWCVSIWVAAVAAPIAYFWGSAPWFFVPALALALSHVTGLLSRLEED
jgi:hypothetical protein